MVIMRNDSAYQASKGGVKLGNLTIIDHDKCATQNVYQLSTLVLYFDELFHS